MQAWQDVINASSWTMFECRTRRRIEISHLMCAIRPPLRILSLLRTFMALWSCFRSSARSKHGRPSRRFHDLGACLSCREGACGLSPSASLLPTHDMMCEFCFLSFLCNIAHVSILFDSRLFLYRSE